MRIGRVTRILEVVELAPPAVDAPTTTEPEPVTAAPVDDAVGAVRP
jgi:hypothetical protein